MWYSHDNYCQKNLVYTEQYFDVLYSEQRAPSYGSNVTDSNELKTRSNRSPAATLQLHSLMS
jgi:hypothetical protein